METELKIARHNAAKIDDLIGEIFHGAINLSNIDKIKLIEGVAIFIIGAMCRNMFKKLIHQQKFCDSVMKHCKKALENGMMEFNQ